MLMLLLLLLLETGVEGMVQECSLSGRSHWRPTQEWLPQGSNPQPEHMQEVGAVLEEYPAANIAVTLAVEGV